MTRANLALIAKVARAETAPALPGPSTFADSRPSELEAIDTLERVRIWRPDDLRPLAMLAILYERQGRHRDAQAVAAQGLVLDPNLRAKEAADLAAGLVVVLGENPPPGFEALLRRAGIP